MNIDFQEGKQQVLSCVNTNMEFWENTTLINRILYLNAKVDIGANVICEHCEIRIAPRTCVYISQSGSLNLRNCVIKGAEPGEPWRSKDKYGCLVQGSGVLKIENCRVEDLTIDSTEQWAVNSTGRVKLEKVDFYDCVGNFFRSDANFLAEEVKTENFAGQFFSSPEHPLKRLFGNWSEDEEDDLWDETDDDEDEEDDLEDEIYDEDELDDDSEEDKEYDGIAFACCDFNFAPRKKYHFSVPPFIKVTDFNIILGCNFTAQGDSDQWDSCCLFLARSDTDSCEFNDCVKILSKYSTFENCSFVNSKLCQK